MKHEIKYCVNYNNPVAKKHLRVFCQCYIIFQFGINWDLFGINWDLYDSS